MDAEHGKLRGKESLGQEGQAERKESPAPVVVSALVPGDCFSGRVGRKWTQSGGLTVALEGSTSRDLLQAFSSVALVEHELQLGNIAGNGVARIDEEVAIDGKTPGTVKGVAEQAASVATSAGKTLVSVPDQKQLCSSPGMDSFKEVGASAAASGPGREESWICAICHNLIPLAETARVTGCDHHYCANCILQWCSYKSYPWCPQCRTPFESLSLFKMLDGSISDVMVEESICLLLRAPWYEPVEIPVFADPEEYAVDEVEDYEEDEYYTNTLRIGNRRWGENGYVRNGRLQARVAAPQGSSASANSGRRAGGSGSARSGSSSSAGAAKGTTPESNSGMGRRAKRAQKREEADKAAGVAPSRSGRQPKGRVM